MSETPTEKVVAVPTPSITEPNWWRSAVFYQIYPRSFQDTTGNGIGDLTGIKAELDYVKSLGVDALWLSPFYPSPQVDAGYDVSDYCDVDPLFGSLEDFDQMLEAAHKRGLRVIIDLVPNHCSDQHPLFQAALAAGPGSPERDMFHFVDGKGPNGDERPSNWVSAFGGPSWTRVVEADGTPGQWYYHLFAPEQPDFNWENPKVMEFFKGVLRFWLDRGADGFRIDVSDALIKDTAWEDHPEGLPAIPKDDGSPVHDIYRELRGVFEEYPGSMAVIETGAEDDVVALFLRPGQMHQAFNFRFLKSPWNPAVLTTAISESLAAYDNVGAPTTWVIDNHDSTRSVTRYARASSLTGAYVPEGADLSPLSEEETETGLRRVRAMTLLYLSLPGSAYIYAGQELGLPEVTDLPDEVLQDPIFFKTGGRSRGRDGCRVPLPWSGKAAPFGFGPENAEDVPWLPQPESWADLSVEAQDADPGSTLNLYRQMLELRSVNPALGTGKLEWLQDAEQAGATQTICALLTAPGGEQARVIVNFGDEPVELPNEKVLLTSSSLTDGKLAPNSAVITTPR